MFGCCNTLFPSCCRCRQCGNPQPPVPAPFFPPLPPTPPTPTPKLRGLEATFTAGSGATVADGFPIPFNELVSNNAIGASFATGSITLTLPGTYLVHWWVALDPTLPPAVEKSGQAAQAGQTATEIGFAASLNGEILSGAYAPCGTGQISGSALVTVTSSPSTLQIVNDSGENVTLAEIPTAQAGVTVTQLS